LLCVSIVPLSMMFVMGIKCASFYDFWTVPIVCYFISFWKSAKYEQLFQNYDIYNSGAGTAYPSGAPEFTSGFSGVRVTRSLVLCVCSVDRCLYLCPFSFGHCVVCPSSICWFWLPREA